MKAVLAFVLMAGAADAASLRPPSAYDREYVGVMNVQRLPKASVDRECEALLGGEFAGPVYGCAVAVDGVCHMILATYAKVKDKQMLYRHELAHCNGWTH